MKKAKLLIAVAAAAIGVTAVSAVAVSAADGKLGTVLHAARAEVEQLDPAAGEGMFVPGNAVYVGIRTAEGAWWENDGALFQVYFAGDGGEAWTEPMTLAENATTENGAFKLYETTAPEYPDGVTAWNLAVVCRMDPNSEKIGWDAKWNQTTDIKAPQDGTVINCIEVWDDNMVSEGDDKGKNNYGTKYFEATDRIASWAGTTGWWGTGEGANNVCDPDGNTDEVELAAKWGDSALTYEKLGYDVKAYFSNLDWTNPTEEHLANNVAHQYDFIIKKYVTLNNFAMRNSLA